ncbi:hypothetical protein BBK36DRAFT_1137438 [Trichoderma citrinoviride]|uniref:Uncharacterized protein n=1 Tax=Trichoderma citrinoviride TaxID=58853 RepID=A0A2T4BN81_9HYPO|nr:hypothetical protein BBK36DRAFT_1137438 [Trichoderma citrinoviride]PTB70784.1 hypothetical protein BBK36DRAFT_1137438 [Trichoderma citrinoviride]
MTLSLLSRSLLFAPEPGLDQLGMKPTFCSGLQYIGLGEAYRADQATTTAYCPEHQPVPPFTGISWHDRAKRGPRCAVAAAQELQYRIQEAEQQGGETTAKQTVGAVPQLLLELTICWLQACLSVYTYTQPLQADVPVLHGPKPSDSRWGRDQRPPTGLMAPTSESIRRPRSCLWLVPTVKAKASAARDSIRLIRSISAMSLLPVWSGDVPP